MPDAPAPPLPPALAAETAASWPARRAALLATLLREQYGPLPPPPPAVTTQLIHRHEVKRLNKAPHEQRRVMVQLQRGMVSFTLDVLRPPGPAACPVVLHGDGCWAYTPDPVVHAVLARGFALARFNRCELMHDPDHGARQGPLVEACPDQPFAALAAWAWAYHRCLDALPDFGGTDPRRVAAIGHSRGGKAVLLAAALDERIAAASVNNSGCGGAGSYHVRGPGCERIADLTSRFPHWFAPAFAAYAHREHDLSFDQHVLLAAVAPRALLTIEAAEDLWANGVGTRAAHAAARPVFQALGAPDRLRLHERPGAHSHTLDDWRVALDFFARALQ